MYALAESLTKQIQNVPELTLLAKEISMQNVEDISWFLLVSYHKV